MTSVSNPRDGGDDGDVSDDVTVLTFELDATSYCVAADAVASVLGVNGEETLTSAADPWNAGTVTVAGERVRVIDLPRVFTSTMRPGDRVDEPKLLVFTPPDDGDTYYGWLVDEVGTTETVRTAALEPTRIATGTRYVRGRIEIDDSAVVWLDERTIHA
ncbi:chemotaxis protein CheW [Halosolutus amylolyticus]|uniref:Chemotaxis protein CheW n=1 Tax=Halosolutus amylolyticus TaxID=2932267 RepID=A0ABD5PTC2_9EURY|nr:chemotaxis protein CheW [Halosolutus amylolyticus]